MLGIGLVFLGGLIVGYFIWGDGSKKFKPAMSGLFRPNTNKGAGGPPPSPGGPPPPSGGGSDVNDGDFY